MNKELLWRAVIFILALVFMFWLLNEFVVSLNDIQISDDVKGKFLIIIGS